MENSFKIGKVEAICAICIVMVNRIILNLPYSILKTTGSGSVINLIYIGIIGLLFVLAINKLFKKFPSSDIIDLAEFCGGKFLKTIVGIFFICLFFLTLFTTLIDFVNLLKIIYFNNSPIIFITLFFILALLIANLIGFRPIIKNICLILPFTILSIIVTFFSVYKDFSFNNFSPILGDGIESVFLTGLTNLFSFSIINFFFFFKPLLKNSFDFSKVTIISFIISWALLFVTMLSLLTSFPVSNDVDTINFIYLLARKVSFGNFLQRTDALFILLWILSIFSYLSIITFLLNSVFKKITHSADSTQFSYLVAIILLGACLYPINIANLKFLQNTIYKYGVLISIFALSFGILIWANLKFKHEQKVGGKK
jgi:spore germination protein (amino acid permease)